MLNDDALSVPETKGTVLRRAHLSLAQCAVPGWDLLRTFPGKIIGQRDFTCSHISKLHSSLFFFFDIRN